MKTIQLNNGNRFQVYRSLFDKNLVFCFKGNVVPNLATCSPYKAKQVAEAIWGELSFDAPEEDKK